MLVKLRLRGIGRSPALRALLITLALVLLYGIPVPNPDPTQNLDRLREVGVGLGKAIDVLTGDA